MHRAYEQAQWQRSCAIQQTLYAVNGIRTNLNELNPYHMHDEQQEAYDQFWRELQRIPLMPTAEARQQAIGGLLHG